jgi:hypothetical protein
MRWKKIICGKASQARINARHGFWTPQGQDLVDDLVTTMGAAAMIVKMEGSP